MSNIPIKNLLDLGFSINEAKVYLCIIRQGYVSVKEISNSTGIHYQDVYKILSRLEEKGLVLRSREKPCKFELIPPEIGLKRLAFLIKDNIKKQLYAVKKNSVELLRYVRELTWYKENLLSYDIKNSYIFFVDENKYSKIDWTFKKLKSRFDFVLPDDLFIWTWLDDVKRLAKHRVKIQILILSKYSKCILADAFKNAMPRTANFEIKILQCPLKFFFALYDDKEAWIIILSMRKPQALVTNAPEIVTILTYLFKELWNHPQAKTIHRNLQTIYPPA